MRSGVGSGMILGGEEGMRASGAGCGGEQRRVLGYGGRGSLLVLRRLLALQASASGFGLVLRLLKVQCWWKVESDKTTKNRSWGTM